MEQIKKIAKEYFEGVGFSQDLSPFEIFEKGVEVGFKLKLEENPALKDEWVRQTIPLTKKQFEKIYKKLCDET